MTLFRIIFNMLEINYFFFLFKGGAADPESDLPPPLHRGRLYSLLGSFKPSQSRLGLDISPGRQHSLVRIEKIFRLNISLFYLGARS